MVACFKSTGNLDSVSDSLTILDNKEWISSEQFFISPTEIESYAYLFVVIPANTSSRLVRNKTKSFEKQSGLFSITLDISIIYMTYFYSSLQVIANSDDLLMTKFWKFITKNDIW